MSPVGKALWFIETHLSDRITLDDIADAGGVSRHHLVRSFGEATGRSVMRYVRARRLSEAARALADGATDILGVALDAGYGSHEAFTRAFRDQLGLTPDAMRARRHIDGINLVEPLSMHTDVTSELRPPRIEDGRILLIAGLGARYNKSDIAGIPAQWQRFVAHVGNLQGEVPGLTYGVCCNPDDDCNFDYIAGVEVTDFAGLPAELTRLRIPAQRYAVFHHQDHVSSIHRTWTAIWDEWMPRSGCQPADAPDFEHYGEAFDPPTGLGGCEIWIPVGRCVVPARRGRDETARYARH